MKPLDLEILKAKQARLAKRLESAKKVAPLPPPPPQKTSYAILDQETLSSGWPIYIAKRSKDGKKVKVRHGKYLKLKREGRLVYSLLPEHFREARPERGFFGIQTKSGGSRLTIVGTLNNTWTDLMCWHEDYQRTIHVKVEDLFPKDLVNNSIEFLKNLNK